MSAVLRVRGTAVPWRSETRAAADEDRLPHDRFDPGPPSALASGLATIQSCGVTRDPIGRGASARSRSASPQFSVAMMEAIVSAD